MRIMNWKRAAVIAAGAVLLTAGCKKNVLDGGTNADMPAFEGKFVISAEEASEKIEDEDVLFVDARGSKRALLGTVKGAAATDWESLSTCQEGSAGDEGWGLVPEPEELTRRLQELGIEKEKEIIVLGQPEEGWGEDGRVLWELRQAGCENIKIVDGGVEALKRAGVSMKLGASKTDKSGIVVEELDKSHDITTEELKADYEDYKIVDVRTKEEYDGAILYNEAKGGHLPGAVHIPYTEFFQGDGTLKSNEALTKLFEDNGLKTTDKIVTYCTGGIRSAYAQLVLEMCGYEESYNYGQSFWRWAAVENVE